MKSGNSNLPNSTAKACFRNVIKLNIASVIFGLCTLVLHIGAISANAAVIVTNTATLDVVADVGIRDDLPTANQNGTQVIVGNIGSGASLYGLVRFDTSTIDIPSGSTFEVTSVSLNTVNSSTAGAGSLTIRVYDYAYDFGETTATWNNPAGDGSDATAGGTIGLLLSSSSVNVTANASNSFGSTSNFVSIVETAVTSDNTVNLLLKRSSYISSNSFTRFLGDEGGVGFQLVVTYTYIPPPAGTVLVIK